VPENGEPIKRHCPLRTAQVRTAQAWRQRPTSRQSDGLQREIRPFSLDIAKEKLIHMRSTIVSTNIRASYHFEWGSWFGSHDRT
jgi:hypothetical protein